MTAGNLHGARAAAPFIRVPGVLFDRIHADLQRSHAFAEERVGFLLTRNCGTFGAIGFEYVAVDDRHYINDPTSGARIGNDAIRSILQTSLSQKCGVFHVHAHLGRGIPRLSPTDRNEIPRLVQSFLSLTPEATHGILLLNESSASGWVWVPRSKGHVELGHLSVVGEHVAFLGPAFVPEEGEVSADGRFSRQSFLGANAQATFEQMRVAVVGLGGGGSHIAQQLAHLGFGDVYLFDTDRVEESNLNRLVGATAQDALNRTLKVEVAQRVMRAVNPSCRVHARPIRWQNAPDLLMQCDLVFGCLDTFTDRDQLEAACRRYLTAYIDIGMNVHAGTPPRMAGQVAVSLPGRPCLKCLGIVTADNLGNEAAAYGAAGPRPQVVFANGILASIAVAQGVDLVTGWSGREVLCPHLVLDGNMCVVHEDRRLPYQPKACAHYVTHDVGAVRFSPVLV